MIYHDFVAKYGDRPKDIVYSIAYREGQIDTRKETLKEVAEWLSKNPHLLSLFELEALMHGKMPE